ncbi:multiple sugar transport system substrate-binding protein [Friedmanniella endophytica]|uniref:Multiple sugar transport system substrate-binding protein n=1 Tax=Microlunatus kandeliicorticis TaxID=1759536 RepID=A0A7W3IVJ0_9ACTN|nr:extracellular solute-binding protein [Microlunatus kandeliicorticis]MBA8796027.1 multiple sugar transport system substrate-binding protein [Microlunatus kandeliicorticis]
MGATLTRRRLLAGAAGAAAAAALGGCGTDDPNTLVVMGNNPAEVTDQDVAEFVHAHPGVTVKFVAVDQSLLTAMFAAGNPPDLVRDQGVNNTPYLVARDLAENLDPYFARSTALSVDKLAPANDVWRYDGSRQGSGPRYGLVKDYSQDAMFWCNTTVFDAAGVDLPSTTEPIDYDEWLDLARRLTKRNGAQYRTYGLVPPFDNSLSAGFINMVSSAGGSIFSEDFSTVDFSSPEAAAALRWYLTYAADQVGSTVARPLPAGSSPTFSADQLAMLGYGYWFSGLVSADDTLAKDVMFFPAPRFGPKRTSPCLAGTGFWIPKRAKHKDLAWAFCEHYFGGPPATRRAQSGWGLPGITSLLSDLPSDKPYQRQALGVQKTELDHFSVLDFSPYVAYTALDASLSQQLRKGIEAGLPAGKVADLINDTLNPLLKLGKELVS